MTGCKFYGHAAAIGTLFPTGGNQCALVTNAHAPCRMEMEGQEPNWERCPLNTPEMAPKAFNLSGTPGTWGA